MGKLIKETKVLSNTIENGIQIIVKEHTLHNGKTMLTTLINHIPELKLK